MRVERRGVKFEEKTVPTRFVKEGDKALQKAGFTAAYTVGCRHRPIARRHAPLRLLLSPP